MIYDLNNLVNEDISIKESVFKDDELDKRIIDLKDALVDGNIYMNSANEIIIDINFKGTMIIEDSISLEPVSYEFSMDINENLDNVVENYPESYQKSKNILDLKRILWQNIVLEVPISYTCVKDANIKGRGWELNREVLNDDIDPRLKKLEDLLKGDD